MTLFRKWRAAFLYGRALGKFNRRRYKDAARLFRTVSALETNGERKELTYSYLGRSYLALGQKNDALEAMSQAYELFRKRSQNIRDESGKRELLIFLNEYTDVLLKAGQEDRAKEVLRDVEKHKLG